jgi:DNA-binding transcriptional ArsR family regulator
MRSPQTLPRRLVPALGITLASSLLLGALVVTADAGDAPPALPAWFGVAAPQQGDAWHYNVTLGGGWTFGGKDTVAAGKASPFAALRWAGGGQARGGDGFLHVADRLVAEGLQFSPRAVVAGDEGGSGEAGGGAVAADPEAAYWPTATDVSWVLAGAHSVVQSGWSQSGNHTYTNYGLVAGVGASVSRANLHVAAIDFAAPPSCLAWNALQAANVSLAGPLEIFGRCQAGGRFLALPAGTWFAATGVEEVNGVQAVRFEASRNGTYAAWFAPSIPYPVRLQVQLPSLRPAHLEEGDLDLPGERTATLDLVGFAPGAGPLAAADRPSDPAPALALAARTPWGVDDSGVQHPFPLSAAYKAAHDDPAFADLRTYLAAHPAAYAAAAEYDEGTFSQGQDRTWRITLSDGQEEFRVGVTQQSPDPALPIAARGHAPPVVQVQRGFGARFPAPYGLPASGVPAEFPTAASLLARWAAFDASGTAGNAWSFHLECVQKDGDACRSARVATSAGAARFDHAFVYLPAALPGDPYGTETFADIERTVAFGPDGQASEMRVIDDRVDTSSVDAGPLPSAPASSGDAGFHVASAAVAGLPPARWLPEPQQAASVGFAAFLLGAAYWVWPKVKALAFLGLFSRVEAGDLLDHPARQRLAQLVEAEPGIHFHVLAQRAGLANGTATHHLRKLAAAGHVTVRKAGRYACYFPGSRVEAREAAAAPLLKSGGARQVLATVRARPGLSNLELANATGLTPSTVNYHAQRLATAGLVEALRDGRSVRFHPLAPLRSEAANAAA